MSIYEIQTAFIAEASAAPLLFADLAKVELYIAESYRLRAFIELLQNADDAGACRFLIRKAGDKLVVANDGRVFSDDDIIALCRSGASNKQRGTGTIGYRGVGFKSTTGIAHDISVVSGNRAFQFSKALTQQLLGITSDVPLIRVPHPIDEVGASLGTITSLLKSSSFQTVFVFSGLDERMIAEEAEAFDESAMLFLNHVSRVEIDLPTVRRQLVREANPLADGFRTEQIENLMSGVSSRWMVASSNGQAEKIAFALDGDGIVPASPDQSVIHAFMPTTEFSGALFKINGDFSTDPSRKSIDLDSLSSMAFKRCTVLLTDILRRAIEKKQLPGVFSPFVLALPTEGRFRKLLRETLSACFDEVGFILDGMSVKPSEIRLRPDWLPYSDYESLCREIAHVPQETLAYQPGFGDFLKWLGARSLGLEDVLGLLQSQRISPVGYAQVVGHMARQYRFDLTEDRLRDLTDVPLLPTKSAVLSPRCYANEPLQREFKDCVLQQPELDEIRYLAHRLKLPDDLFGKVAPPHTHTPTQSRPNGNSSYQRSEEMQLLKSPFKSQPAIKLWRSAEQNAIAWLTALSDVDNVKDVSQANVGYDLEVMRRDGTRLHVEVKSVTRLGDPFRLTNNEHATAYQLGEAYFLAIVVNRVDDFSIHFVCDPIRTLKLEKRCEQWSWYSDNYLDSLFDSMETQNDSGK